MLRTTLRTVLRRKARLALTALSVVLGVAFVAGTLVLTDSIQSTFDSLFAQSGKNLAVVVRGVEGVGGSQAGESRVPVPAELAGRIGAVDGVVRAQPDYSGVAILVGADGTAVRRGGAPTFGFGADPGDDTFVLEEGRLPTRAGEIAVLDSTLGQSGLSLGSRTTVVAGPGVQPVEVVGAVRFGDGVSLAGSTAVLFDPATARQFYAPDGRVREIRVQARSGVDDDELRERVAAVLPPGVQAITGEQQADENRADIEKVLGFITIFLLVFAGIALFVGAFIILNTFSILVAQRTRELALLRALGAGRGQVRRSVLLEAAAVGLVASLLGLALGLGIATLLKVLLARFGLDIGTELPVRPRTIGAVFAVGLGVTLAAAYLPARRAARVPPLAAMRDEVVNESRGLRWRALTGGLVFAGGIVAMFAGLAPKGDTILPLFFGGMGALFLGVILLAPVLAGPVIRVLGLPLRGTTGRLARDNALRNPRRTAATASALMVGLALVSALTVLAASARASTESLVAERMTAEFALSAGQSPIPAPVAQQARALPQVRSVAALSWANLQLRGGERMFGFATDFGAVQQSFRLDPVAGTLDPTDPRALLISSKAAEDRGWTVGQEVVADVGFLKAQRLVVAGVYEQVPILGDLLLSRTLYEQAVAPAQRADATVFVNLAEGADPAAVRTALAEVVRPYAIVSVLDQDGFVGEAAGQITVIVSTMYALLAIAVLIAIFGIILTLALSVLERTREIGLLRALGLDRRQLRRAIRQEAVLIAVFGAVLGTGLGLMLAVLLQRVLADNGLSTLQVPWLQILLFLAAAALVGVLAALFPARRAARLDIVRAVTTD